MREIAVLLVALWGIFHRIVILGFRNFIAVMVSGVEEEGTRRGTTMFDAIERHCSGVEQAADPEDSVSGVEEPAGEAIVSRVEEERSRQATTFDDIIPSHISGAEEAAPEVPAYSVEQADGDGPTSDEGNEIRFPGTEEIDGCPLLMRQRTSSDVVERAALPESPISGVEEAAGESGASMQYSSGDEEVARTGGKRFRSCLNVRQCTFQCEKIQENGSGTSLDYKSPVRSLKELEEAVEECNSTYLSSTPGIFGIEILPDRFDMNVPELDVTEELIKLLLRINKDCVKFYQLSGSGEASAQSFLQEVFNYAWYNDIPNLMKLAVGMVKSSVVCPMSPFVDKAAMDSAFMSCHTMTELLKLLLEYNPNFVHYFPFPGDGILLPGWKGDKKSWVMMQEYKPNVPWTITGDKGAVLLSLFAVPKNKFRCYVLRSLLGVPKNKFGCYSQMTNSKCTLQNLTSHWKLDVDVTGLKSPWSKNFDKAWHRIKLEVLMQPVLLNNSLTLKISNLKFHSHNAGSDASAGIWSRFFLTGVALTATPEVDPQHFMFTQLGLPSPNPASDIMYGTAWGSSATVPLEKCVPTVAFTCTQTTSVTRSVTDWKHEQTVGTQNCCSPNSGTFSSILKNFGGIPFDQDRPSYPRISKNSRLELPFNEDGSVTFTDKEYPDPITWSFKPELQGTIVVWRISMEVYVSILNNSQSKWQFTSTGETLKFSFARHLKHKLSTD
ncbi:hypothetical protein BDL97_17G087800 [Sphagnum fallax]|nr:hypothetical protein BDL97_17G087800 [Sphagnum fallax]